MTTTGKIVLAGGTGFIGNDFRRRFERLGCQVVDISRRPGHVAWEDDAGIAQALEGAELLVNLAGRTVNCRYNAENQEQILRSRVDTTTKLGKAVEACAAPPKLWINSSTATIYRHAEDRPMTEENGELGAGFSVDVAKAWEEAFFAFRLPRTRQVALRIAIALGPDGGVMTPYLNLVRFGLGGPQGSGRQMFSWIHVEDLFRIVRFVQENERIEGALNAAAPHPVANRELMRSLRAASGRKLGLPAPRPLLELGAWLLRTETELVMKSRWVVPDRLTREGFEFLYPTLDRALQHIISE